MRGKIGGFHEGNRIGGDGLDIERLCHRQRLPGPDLASEIAEILEADIEVIAEDFAEEGENLCGRVPEPDRAKISCLL